MSNPEIKTMDQWRTEQPAFTLTNSSLIPVQIGSTLRAVSVDELAVLMTGQTVVAGRQGTHRSVRVVTDGNAVDATGRVVWGPSSFDTDTMYSGLQPTRLTPPADATLIKLTACLRDSSGAPIECAIGTDNETTPSLVKGSGSVVTGPIQYNSTSYFEVYAAEGANPSSNYSWFCLEVLEQTP